MSVSDGCPICLAYLPMFGRPSATTNIPVGHTYLIAIQSSFDLEPEEPRKRYVVRALEQFSRMQSEREQTLV